MQEAGVPGENHQLVNFSLTAASRVHLLCNKQSRVRTHVALVIGLYELLCNSAATYNARTYLFMYINTNNIKPKKPTTQMGVKTKRTSFLRGHLCTDLKTGDMQLETHKQQESP